MFSNENAEKESELSHYSQEGKSTRAVLSRGDITQCCCEPYHGDSNHTPLDQPGNCIEGIGVDREKVHQWDQTLEYHGTGQDTFFLEVIDNEDQKGENEHSPHASETHDKTDFPGSEP